MCDELQQGILIHRKWRPVFSNLALAQKFGFSDVNEILRSNYAREL
jgi:chorismate synthase